MVNGLVRGLEGERSKDQSNGSPGCRNVGGHVGMGTKGAVKTFALCVNSHQASSTVEVALGN
jgi:hypothetical protein